MTIKLNQSEQNVRIIPSKKDPNSLYFIQFTNKHTKETELITGVADLTPLYNFMTLSFIFEPIEGSEYKYEVLNQNLDIVREGNAFYKYIPTGPSAYDSNENIIVYGE